MAGGRSALFTGQELWTERTGIITFEQVDLWRALPSENQTLEFKEAKAQFDNDKLLQYCVALANEGGGHLLLGICDGNPPPPRKVVGTQAFRDPVKTEEKIFVFVVPSRPYGSAYQYKGAYYMRSGEQLVPMSESQLRTIFSEGKPDWLEEHSRVGLTAREIVELINVKKFFELLKLPYPSDDHAAIERLENDGLVDTIDGKYGIRRLAALLLANDLENFPELARKALRIIVYNGNSKLQTKLERHGTMGYAAGFRGAVRFIGEQLPQNEVIEDAIRKEVKLVPDAVIRELLANALVHQDFRIEGTSVMVEIYENRVEISNPGEPLVPVERFIDGCQSRNEHVAMLMRRFGICEEKSSGIDRVVQAAEVLQLPAPDFRTGYKSTVVTIFGPRDFEEMGRDDRIRACYQHCALKYVMSEQMTNQSLRERFNLPENKSAIVSQIISATIEVGLVKPDEKVGGSRKYARYLPFWA